jgi:uncharacterized membrane protein
MAKLNLAGHPLHSIVNDSVIALLPFALTMDVLHATSQEDSYADAAYYGLVGVIGGALVSAASGALDYLSIPSGSQAKRTANAHALMNVLTLAASAGSLVARGNNPRRPGAWALPLCATANVLMVAGAWYGGHLVFDLGVRVKAVGEPLPGGEIEMPGGSLVQSGLGSLEERVTTTGPDSVESTSPGDASPSGPVDDQAAIRAVEALQPGGEDDRQASS